MAESQNVDDSATTSRRVRLLQTYSHAIQDIEDEEAADKAEDDSVFSYDDDQPGLFHPPPGGSNHASLRKGDGLSKSRSTLTRQRTISDAMEHLIHMDENMAPFKLINFLLHGGIASTLPYFTLYSRQIGLDAAQLGIVCGIRPLLGTLVAPLMGWFSDRYHLRRVCASLCVVSWVLFAVLVAFVTPPELAECDIAIDNLKEMLPTDVVEGMDLSCLDFRNNENLHYPATDSLTRHLFLDKVIFPNITTDIKGDCELETSWNNPSTDSENRTDQADGVGDGSKRISAVEIFERRNLDVGEADIESTKQQAQGGSWLFDTVTLRDAFVAAFILASFAEMMQVSTISLVDVATLDNLPRGEKREGYAWQRAFGVTGFVTYSIIIIFVLAFSHTIVTICGIGVEFADYKVAFVLLAGTISGGAAVVCTLTFKYEPTNPTYYFREVLDVLLTLKYGSILLTAFFLAFCNGCINTFLLWHLEKLGATDLIIVFALVAFGLSEVAISFHFPALVKSLGHACLILIGVWIYCFIFTGYALMDNPRWVVILEIFHGAAFALTWNPMTTYLTGAVSRQYLATMQGVLSGTYHGLGNVLGSICAGLLVRSIGVVVTFYGFAVMCMVYGVLFLVVNRDTGILNNCRQQYEKYETIGKQLN